MGCIYVDNNGIAYNGFHFDCDEKVPKQLKRRRLDIRAFEINACYGTLQNILEDTQLYKGMVEEDYKMFLNCLSSYSNLRQFETEDWADDSDNNGVHESDEEDYVEPHFRMFMENLKKDGQSYVFLYAINKSMSLSIKYEPDGVSDDEHELPSPRKSRKIPDKVKMGDTKYLRNCLNKDKTETPRNLRHTVNKDTSNCSESKASIIAKERGNSVANKDLKSASINHVSSGMNISCQNPNPKANTSSSKRSQHKQAFEHVDECLETYMTLIKESADSTAKKERRNSVAKKDLKSEPVNHVSDGIDISCQKPSPKENISSSKESQLEKADQTIDECYETFLNQVKENGDSLAFLMNDDEQVSSPKGNTSSSKESQLEKADQTIDECYETFLNHIKENGESLAFLMNDDVKVTHEGNGAEISGSEVLMTYNAADLSEGKYNPLETSRLVDSSVADDKQKYLGSPETDNHSEFRKKLISKLQEPFDLKEYKELWGLVNERKPKDGRHRDLRGDAALKSYRTDELNPSYLQCFGGFKRKLYSVKPNRLKELNLLRGFVFWLENLAHEDAFQPWLKPSFLAISCDTEK